MHEQSNIHRQYLKQLYDYVSYLLVIQDGYQVVESYE